MVAAVFRLVYLVIEKANTPLGIMMQSREENGRRALIVTSVIPGSFADSKGVLVNSALVQVASTHVDGHDLSWVARMLRKQAYPLTMIFRNPIVEGLSIQIPEGWTEATNLSRRSAVASMYSPEDLFVNLSKYGADGGVEAATARAVKALEGEIGSILTGFCALEPFNDFVDDLFKLHMYLLDHLSSTTVHTFTYEVPMALRSRFPRLVQLHGRVAEHLKDSAWALRFKAEYEATQKALRPPTFQIKAYRNYLMRLDRQEPRPARKPKRPRDEPKPVVSPAPRIGQYTAVFLRQLSRKLSLKITTYAKTELKIAMQIVTETNHSELLKLKSKLKSVLAAHDAGLQNWKTSMLLGFARMLTRLSVNRQQRILLYASADRPATMKNPESNSKSFQRKIEAFRPAHHSALMAACAQAPTALAQARAANAVKVSAHKARITLESRKAFVKLCVERIVLMAKPSWQIAKRMREHERALNQEEARLRDLFAQENERDLKTARRDKSSMGTYYLATRSQALEAAISTLRREAGLQTANVSEDLAKAKAFDPLFDASLNCPDLVTDSMRASFAAYLLHKSDSLKAGFDMVNECRGFAWRAWKDLHALMDSLASGVAPESSFHDALCAPVKDYLDRFIELNSARVDLAARMDSSVPTSPLALDCIQGFLKTDVEIEAPKAEHAHVWTDLAGFASFCTVCGEERSPDAEVLDDTFLEGLLEEDDEEAAEAEVEEKPPAPCVFATEEDDEEPPPF